MLGSVSGWLGSGKSTFLALLAKSAHPTTQIYSNFHLKLKGAKQIEVEDLEGIREGLLLIDEAYIWLESRVSSSTLNRYITKIIFQSRKRGMDVFLSTQLRSAVDLRFTNLEDVTVYAMGLTPDESAFIYWISGWGKHKQFHLPYKKAQELFPIFDTMEYPEISPSVFEPKRYNREISKFVKLIESKYKNPERMTQKLIRDLLIERGISDSLIAEGVWARLKRKSLEV